MNKAAFRSSRPELFPQKGALERRSKSRGEHVCGSVMATKLLRNFIEITLPHGLSLSLEFTACYCVFLSQIDLLNNSANLKSCR